MSLEADCEKIRRLGKYFSTVATGDGSQLLLTKQLIGESTVPGDAWGHLPMSQGLEDSYNSARKSHDDNLKTAADYLSAAGEALQKVAANIMKAEQDSTVGGGG